MSHPDSSASKPAVVPPPTVLGANAPQPGTERPYQGGPLRPTVKLAATTGSTFPVGATLARPVPAPLPERGAPVFFLISVVGALIAVSFLLLLALKI